MYEVWSESNTGQDPDATFETLEAAKQEVEAQGEARREQYYIENTSTCATWGIVDGVWKENV